MEFRELSNEEWELIRPLLPPKARTGRPRINDRLVINGILYVLITGCRWMDMPIKYALIRLLGIGLSIGALKVYGLKYSKL